MCIHRFEESRDDWSRITDDDAVKNGSKCFNDVRTDSAPVLARHGILRLLRLKLAAQHGIVEVPYSK